MSLNTARNFYGNTESMTYKITVLPATAAVINLFVITVLNFIYDYLAIFLTDLEMKRTQAEYDESLSLKIYLFQFVNYYSSIFYIAFFKGKFPGILPNIIEFLDYVKKNVVQEIVCLNYVFN